MVRNGWVIDLGRAHPDTDRPSRHRADAAEAVARDLRRHGLAALRSVEEN